MLFVGVGLCCAHYGGFKWSAQQGLSSGGLVLDKGGCCGSSLDAFAG